MINDGEMARGEHFVEDVLRTKARARERWVVGLPAAGLALAGFCLFAWVRRKRTNASAELTSG